MDTFSAPFVVHPGSKLGRITGAHRILVATDFGGTLCQPPREVPHPDAIRALERLSSIPGVHLAVASGRGQRELAEVCGSLPACWKISDHGRACTDPSGRILSDWPSHAGTGPLQRALLQGEALFHGSGARVELKEFSVLVRMPGQFSPQSFEPAARWCTLVRSFGLEVVRGRGFLEALVPGFDKRRALIRLSAHLKCDFRVFGGDDGHDLPALGEFATRIDGLAVFVSSTERPAPGIRVDGTVDGPAGWAAWLSEFADILEARAG